MHSAQTPSKSTTPGSSPERPALPRPGHEADPLVVLLARAAHGDEAAQRTFAAARAARIRMNYRLTERHRATALRMLRSGRL